MAELEEQLGQAQAENAALKAESAQLKQRIAEFERAAKRQATPFARDEPKAEPKRPGRKAGHGLFSYRARPTPDEVDETKEARWDRCPECGGAVTDVKAHEQFVIDLPEVRPQLTRSVTESGYCSRCGRRGRARQPEQIAAARGAAGRRMGPRAKALAADLKPRVGVPFAKVCAGLEVGFWLRWPRSGACQAEARLAAPARAVYQELIGLIRHCAVAHADETGGRIGTLAAWRWVFTTRQATVYPIKERRGHDVVVEILGQEVAGILVSDCFWASEHRELAEWLKPKCLGHLLKDLRQREAEKTRGAVRFAQAGRAVLRTALGLREQKLQLSPAAFAAQAAKIAHRLERLIDEKRRLTDPDNIGRAKRRRTQREHWLRFLYVEGLDATNNQAERMLRPAVITRKTSGCNRTEGGAEAHAILASIVVTCRQRALSTVDFLIRLQRAAGRAIPSVVPAPPLDTS